MSCILMGMTTRREFTYHAHLMGTESECAIVTHHEAEAQAGYERALAIGRALEARFSRFLPQSELSMLNREKKRTVSQEFLRATLLARTLYEETDGVFNVLTNVSSRGYTTDFESMPKDVALDPATTVSNTNFEEVIIDVSTQTITLRNDQMLDFGGFMKGHTAQRMAEALAGMGGSIVNLGGDSYTLGTDTDDQPFTFSVYNPLTNTYPVSIPVKDAAVATSGTYRRTWRINGTLTHHIMTTEESSDDIVSATVVHKEGARADAYATTAIALGAEDAVQFLTRIETPYVLITRNGSLIRSTPLV
jgi:FAD:protein FMN transferase